MQTINKSLSNLKVSDLAGAKSANTFEEVVLPAGEYVMKFLGCVEEETYSYFKTQINGKNFNFFFNLFLKDSDTLNLDVLQWIQGLSTITYNEQTSLNEIVNSAIGSSYKIGIYNYTSKSGKNAGKTQHAIDFKVKPVLQAVTTPEIETLEIPF